MARPKEPDTTFQINLPPTTTAHQDLIVAGQRRINFIWELTQAIIAVAVVFANLAVGIIFAIYRVPAGEFPLVLSSSLFLVVGFYFSRTNHSNIGGVGIKLNETQPYTGR